VVVSVPPSSVDPDTERVRRAGVELEGECVARARVADGGGTPRERVGEHLHRPSVAAEVEPIESDALDGYRPVERVAPVAERAVERRVCAHTPAVLRQHDGVAVFEREQRMECP
jgi:hypothetical protein